MPLGAFRINSLANNKIDPGTFQGYFRGSSSTVVNAYNTAGTSINAVTHGCGTVNQIRAVRIPYTSTFVVGIAGSTNTKFYYWSTSGWSLLASVGAAGWTSDISFDPTTNKGYFAATAGTAPYISLWEYDIPTKTATGLADPAVVPTGVARHIAFSPNSKLLAINHATSPYLRVYSRSGQTFTSQTLPGLNAPSGPPDTINRKFQLAWNSDSNILAYVVVSNTIGFYKWNSGLTYLNTAAITGGPAGSLGFNPNPAYSKVLIYADTNDNGGVIYFDNTALPVVTATNSLYPFRQPLWSPDGLKVATASSASTLDDYNFNTAYTTSTLIASLVTAIAGAPTGSVAFDWMYY